MSGSETASLARIPSPTKIRAEHHVLLVDHTVSRTPSYRDDTDAERSDSDAPTTPGPATLSKRLTNNSLRQTVRTQYQKQKYSKYSQQRYNVHENTPPQVPEDDIADAPQAGQDASPAQKGYLERAQTKAKALLKRKRTLGKGDDQDTVVDILYENQRGFFFFGIPKYSNSSLLPSDPKPWQNGQFRTSAVDIRNAQVPDPSWEWAWKSWYVDMSRDVDEEGWEYSFAFVGRGGATFAWHGNHPWFHSFVRRRRWLRMRKRKDSRHHTREKGHEFTSEYFTIHPKTVRPASLSDKDGGSSTIVKAIAKLRDPVLELDNMEISTIGELFLALRKASVDREKILAIRKFIDEAGEELFYLSDRMEDVMGMLIFQSSRRQLLSSLVERHEEIHNKQQALDAHEHDDDEEKQLEHERAARRADNLLKAIHAAEEQVRRLEYWSDIRGITDVGTETGNEHAHDRPSFQNKQAAGESAHEPHKQAEPQFGGKGKQNAKDTASEAPSKKSSVWFDSESKGGDDDSELDRYTTASESTTDTIKGRGKAKARTLDGVAENPNEHDNEKLVSAITGARSNRRSVQIVEPVPETINGNDYEDEGDVVEEENQDDEFFEPGSPPNREEAKTPDSIGGFLKTMRKPKNWIDQAFG